MKKALKNKKGFTLVELMVVVAVMAVLAMVAIPAFSKSTAKAQAGTCEANRRIIVSAIQQAVLAEDTAVVTNSGGTYALVSGLTVDTLKTAGYFAEGSEPVCPTKGTYTITIDAATGVASVACDATGHN